MPTDSTQADQFIKKLDLPAVKGTVKILRSKYYFVEGRKRTLIPAGFISEAKLKNMVDKKMVAIRKEDNIIAIFPYEEAIAKWPFRCFICYLPAPDHWGRIDVEIQHNLVNYFEKINVLKGAQANALKEVIAH